MLPVIPMVSLTAFFIAQLIAEERFFFPGANSMLLNSSIIIVPVIAWSLLGVKAFALGVFLGFSLQLVAQGWAVLGRRHPKSSQFTGKAPSLWRDAAIMIAPVVLLYLVAGMNVLIPRRFASGLGEGNLAIFTYATRASMPIYMLGVFAISYPYFSTFAKAIAMGETDQAGRLLRSMLRSVVLFGVPAVSAIVVLRVPLVRVLFFRGAFDKQSADLVAMTLVFLAPFVLGSLVADLLARCLIGMGHTVIACVLYGVMFVLCWVLMRGLHGFGGLKGVSAAWAASFYVVAALFLVAVNHYLRGEAFRGISLSLGWALLSGVAAAVAMAISNYCLSPWFGTGLVLSVANMMLTILAGGVVLVGLARRLGVSEAMAFVDVIQAPGNRLRSWFYER
jgi:putative peptidoglycan lipid II flippase